MVDEQLKKQVIQDVTLLKLVGFQAYHHYTAEARKSANG